MQYTTITILRFYHIHHRWLKSYAKDSFILSFSVDNLLALYRLYRSRFWKSRFRWILCIFVFNYILVIALATSNGLNFTVLGGFNLKGEDFSISIMIEVAKQLKRFQSITMEEKRIWNLKPQIAFLLFEASTIRWNDSTTNFECIFSIVCIMAKNLFDFSRHSCFVFIAWMRCIRKGFWFFTQSI